MRRSLPLLIGFIIFGCFVAACDSDPEQPEQNLPTPRAVADTAYTVTSTGLKYYDFEVGAGDSAKAGDQVQVHYSGWLTNGQLFDTSIGRQPIQFILGGNQVIPGFDEGITGMQVGGDRQIVIPPDLAYGQTGNGAIPPNATLIFEIQLVNVVHASSSASSNP
ncbi:MAG TPA: FKBP-type peptidyl-prolyl cis-trans isomerase [Rhodothermales bacterium]|nr:FKBP-type peptidyl-prolyl cis-trans isomerase [Rhodothermales bacterium]